MNVYIIGLICFVFGYMTHKLFLSFLNLGHTMILCKQMILDCLYMDNWKDMCSRKILGSYPQIAKGQLKFNDWAGAMKFLQENNNDKR